MRERTTIGFYIKQINNGYEKEFNNRLRTLPPSARFWTISLQAGKRK